MYTETKRLIKTMVEAYYASSIVAFEEPALATAILNLEKHVKADDAALKAQQSDAVTIKDY